ncbi:MAG: drug/metabolite exporter YedA, partial [Gemmatimonadales bacterium]|nr:drug/metabolite exporter YedA [Gemmatimonadales bacterium]
MTAPANRPATLGLILAFAAVYLVWGSTYLAIRFAIQTIPPFLMAGIRFTCAGGVLYAWCRWRGIPAPTARQWLSALIVGGLMLTAGNGLVVWAELRVPSGIAALIVATSPFWMVLLDWWWRGARRPDAAVIGGLMIGFAGVAFLVNPWRDGATNVDPTGALALLGAALFWAMGSIYSLRATKPASHLVFTATAMLCGGILLLIGGTARGEWAEFRPSAFSLQSTLGLLYLIVFGSLITYSAYVWLLRVSTPAKVSTTAYVNPVVAVLLGWMLGGEGLSSRTLVATIVIIASVVLITSARLRQR